jgi:predicted ArsR family transcriptional regulator
MSLESDSGRSGQRWRLLDDPVAIRALAHPLRHDLMSIIGRLGRATTADAARELGISHGLASHHLRQLAKYGFVEQVAGKDHRERPWRLVATSYSWGQVRDTAEGSVAVGVLEQLRAERAVEALLDWQQRRKDWPAGWREHSGIGESTVVAGLVMLRCLKDEGEHVSLAAGEPATACPGRPEDSGRREKIHAAAHPGGRVDPG